jgi:anti-sigma B factor antagonist
LTIKVVERAGVDATVVEVDGELDLDSAPMLRAVLEDAVDRGDTRIVVEASQLRFCDSVGLSVLLTTHFICEARGGYLRLAAPVDQLLHLLSVVGLATHVISYRTVDAAVRGRAEDIVTAAVDPLDQY